MSQAYHRDQSAASARDSLAVEDIVSVDFLLESSCSVRGGRRAGLSVTSGSRYDDITRQERVREDTPWICMLHVSPVWTSK